MTHSWPCSTRTATCSRGVIATLLVLGLLLSATPAQATEPGAGVFVGWEYPPATVFTNMATLCARFDPNEPFPGVTDPSGPLVHWLEMDGTLHGVIGDGIAEFTSTMDPYYANPTGTYSDPDCTNPSDVPGTIDIDFEDFNCSGDGAYQRLATSAYTLEFDGTCDNGGGATYVLFSGVQEPCVGACPGAPDPDPVDPDGPSAMMQGDYVQTDGPPL